MPLTEANESYSSGYREANTTVNKSCWAFSFKFHKCWRCSSLLCLPTTFLKQKTEVQLLLCGWSDDLHVVRCLWGGYFYRGCKPWDCYLPGGPLKLGAPQLFWKRGERRGSTASSKSQSLQAFGCDLLSNRGGRWKAFLMGRIIG